MISLIILAILSFFGLLTFAVGLMDAAKRGDEAMQNFPELSPAATARDAQGFGEQAHSDKVDLHDAGTPPEMYGNGSLKVPQDVRPLAVTAPD